MIRVALADKDRVVAQALGRLIEVEDDMTVTGIWSDGPTLLRELRRRVPDVAVIEPVGLTHLGAEFIHQVVASCPSVRVVVLTASEREPDLYAAVRAGVRGYISKQSDVDEVLRAIRAAHDGAAVVSRDRARQLMEEFARRSRAQTGLTPRQCDLLAGIVQGKSNREISRDLALAEKTVKNCITELFDILEVHDRTEAAVCALTHGLVATPMPAAFD